MTASVDHVLQPQLVAASAARRRRELFRSWSMPLVMALPFAALLSMFMLQYSMYVIYSIFWDRVIKLASLLLLLTVFPYRRIARKFRWTLFLYGALFLSAALGSLLRVDGQGIEQLLKVVLPFLIVPIVVLRFKHGDAPAPVLVKLLLFWGSLFSIQVLALWSRVLQGDPPRRTLVILERLDHLPNSTLGWYGFGNSLAFAMPGSFNFRATGWFIEPSNLASFLLYPAFVAFGIFLTTRKLRFLLLSMLCAAGLISAFSLAGFMASLAAITVLLVIRPQGKSKGRRPWYFWLAPFVAGLAFLYAAQFALKQTYGIFTRGAQYGYTQLAYLLGRDPSVQKLVQPYYRVQETAQLLIARPFGIGLGDTKGFNETTSPNALMYWAVAGGIPAVIVIALLFAHLLYAYCIPLLMSRIAYYRYIAAAFIGVTVHALSYGTWMTPFYLFIIALMIVAAGHLESLTQPPQRARIAE